MLDYLDYLKKARKWEESVISGYLRFWQKHSHIDLIINRPGVAGAVLQSPQSLTDSLTHPLVNISSKHSQSQNGRGRELNF